MMAGTVLVSVIRAWAAHGCAPDGWPSRSRDPHLDRVIEAIHDAPGRDWSVAGLATLGAMSRTVFAERFRAAFGVSPASYVTEVRIRTAQDLLSAGRAVGEVSRMLGYGSDEGFSRAFRRHTGQTPSAWRAAQAAPATAPSR
jgi:AraC-like DNA-binding protein